MAERVRERSLGARLFSGQRDDLSWWVPGFKPAHTFFERQWKLFQPIAILGAGVLALGILAPWWRGAAVGCVVLTGLGIIMRFRARKSAEALSVEWRAPSAAPERSQVKISLIFRNSGALPLHAVECSIPFTGAMRSLAKLRIDEVPGGGEARAELSFAADAGMGPHWVGPLTLGVSDPLGLWEFEVGDGRRQRVDVLPEPLLGGPDRLPPSLDSMQPGDHESPALGDSQIFAALREYRPGDSVRRIHWRRSLRVGELLVKEFERAVATEVTIVLDMDGKRHAGRGAASTWEYAKEFTAALVRSLGSRGVRVRVLTQGLSTPFGSGQAHEDLLLRTVAHARPAVPAENAGVTDLPYGSSVFWVSPARGWDDFELARRLGALRAEGVRVTAVLVSAGSFLDLDLAVRPVGRSLSDLHREAGRSLERMTRSLREASVDCVVLERDKPLARAWEALS